MTANGEKAQREQKQAGMAAGIADAEAGRPNRLGVKGDPARYVESDAWCKGYGYAYQWKAYGPGRHVAMTDNGGLDD